MRRPQPTPVRQWVQTCPQSRVALWRWQVWRLGKPQEAHHHWQVLRPTCAAGGAMTGHGDVRPRCDAGVWARHDDAYLNSAIPSAFAHYSCLVWRHRVATPATCPVPPHTMHESKYRRNRGGQRTWALHLRSCRIQSCSCRNQSAFAVVRGAVDLSPSRLLPLSPMHCVTSTTQRARHPQPHTFVHLGRLDSTIPAK